MKIEHYIRKIVDDGDRREMEELSDILVDVIDIVKRYDEDCYKEYKTKLYEMAYGKVLNQQLKEDWVKNMRPMAKWTIRQIEDIVSEYNIDIPIYSMYAIMNMFYSDMNNALGSGEDRESLEKYIQIATDWYYDEDAKHTQEEKLYYYWKNIVN